MGALAIPSIAQESLEDFFADNGSPGNPVSDPSGPVPIPSGSTGTFFNDRSAFDAAFITQSCEDFEASGDLGLNAFAAPLNDATNDGGYTPGDIISGVSFQDNPINDSDGVGAATGLINLGASGGFGNASVVLVTNTFTDSMDILVTDPTFTTFGADFVSFVGEAAVDISIFDTSDMLLDSFLAFPATNAEGSFLGYSGSVAIGRISINDPTGGTVEGVDNFCLSAGAGVELPPPPAVPALSRNSLIFMALLLLIGTAITVRRYNK